MADSDDASLSQRDAHYSLQRSSLRSNHSSHPQSRPQSRPQSCPQSRQQSSQLIDFTLRDDGEPPTVPSSPPSPSPAPVIPRRKQSLEKGQRQSNNSGHSRTGSSRSIALTASRGRNIDALLVPDLFDNLNENAGPAPVESRYDHRHSTLEEERTESPASRHQQKRRSAKSSFRRSSPLSRLGASTADLDITALPTMHDSSDAKPHKKPSNEYVLSKRTLAQQRASRVATELYTVSYLIFFSIFGILARLGVQWLTFYPGAPVVFPNIWANFSGTLLMGFLAEDRRLFRAEWGTHVPSSATRPASGDVEKAPEQIREEKTSHSKVKKTIPLYIGLATGFCGSFTSFSSFVRDVFFALSNDLPSPIYHPSPNTPVSTSSTVPRNGGYSVMAVLAVIFLTVALCYSALKVGAHLALFADPITPTLPFRFTRRFLDPLVVFLAWGCWLGAVFMAIWPPDRPGGPSSNNSSWADETWRGQAIFACVFAPLGCLARFYLSLKLNSLSPSFPLGTFSANVFGTAVLGMAFDLQHVSIGNSGLVGGGRVGCQVFQGIMDGFCGALTTASTWILEIDGLRRRHAYVYGTVSVAAGLGILVVVMGSVRWSVGFVTVACAT